MPYKDPDKKKEANKYWYEKNKVRVSEKNKIYRTENKEKTNERNRDWYSKNKEKSRQMHNRGVKANVEKRKLINKKYRDKNKEKIREYSLKSKYGMLSSDYKLMEEKQNHKCLICGRDSNFGGKDKILVVDHCHNTGMVRGLLCYYCNVGLGKFNDSIELLCKAVKYLEDNNDNR